VPVAAIAEHFATVDEIATRTIGIGGLKIHAVMKNGFVVSAVHEGAGFKKLKSGSTECTELMAIAAQLHLYLPAYDLTARIGLH